MLDWTEKEQPGVQCRLLGDLKITGISGCGPAQPRKFPAEGLCIAIGIGARYWQLRQSWS